MATGNTEILLLLETNIEEPLVPAKLNLFQDPRERRFAQSK